MAPPKIISMLNGLVTAEVSIVPDGANNKRFAIRKEASMPFQDVLQKVLATKLEGEDQLVATLKEAGQSDDDIEVAVAQFRMQHGFKDKVSKETMLAVTKAAGYDFGAAPAANPAPDNPAPAPGPEVPAGLSAEMQAVVKSFKDQLQSATDIIKTQGDEIAGMRRDGVKKELVAECKELYSLVPNQTPEQMAEVIMKARDMNDEGTEKAMRDMWASVHKSLESSDLLRDLSAQNIAENGGGVPTPTDKSAYGQLKAIAKEYRAGDATLSDAQAFDLATTNNPRLWAQHRKEHLARTRPVSVQ